MSAASLALADPALLSDLELVEDALAGGEIGFETLVRKYQRPMINYISRLINDREAALDVTQEVFIKVYNSLDKYSSEYKFTTWLYRIAHNAAIDHLRRHPSNLQSIETENADGAYELQLVSSLPSPERDRERSEWRAEIEAVVRCLPMAYRELILLRHSRDLSYDEIAEVTGLPLGTVKNRLFRARELMREMLIERGFQGI